jgi:hypothetical protein
MEITEVDRDSPPDWLAADIRVRRRQSFLRLILPVAFPDGGYGPRFEQRCEKLADSGAWTLLRGEAQSFLPHVRMHFNSTLPRNERGDNPQNGAQPLHPEVAFGYIFKHTGLDGLQIPLELSFRVPGTGHQVGIEITGAQIGIFRMGVGFISLEITPQSEALPDWLDALHFLRFYRARGAALRPARASDGDGPGTIRLENLLGALLAEAVLDGETYPFPPSPAGTARPDWGRVKELYVPGELLTYVAMFADGVPVGERRHFLYHVLNRFRAASDSVPGEDYDLGKWCLPYQKNQQFVTSIQGSAFVAFDAPQNPFNSQTLPSHLRSTYYLLFMLALLQRFALDQVSEAVAWSTGRVLEDTERSHARRELERVTALDTRLLDFTGRCYFVQVSQTEHHHRYYALLREVNQIEERYREVTDEVHALRAHASSRVSVEEERTSLRVATALMVITCVLLPLQVIEALFSTKLPGLPGIRSLSPVSSAVTAGFVLLVALGIALLIIYGRRWKIRGRKRPTGNQADRMPWSEVPRRM